MGTHKELVHDAFLELKSDPEKYSDWQHEFISHLESQFKEGERNSLSKKQLAKVQEILADEA